MCVCDYVKIALVLVKNAFFQFEKGISELSRWVAQKHSLFIASRRLSAAVVFVYVAFFGHVFTYCSVIGSCNSVAKNLIKFA